MRSRRGATRQFVAAAGLGALLLLATPARALAQEGEGASGLGGVGVAESWDWLGLSLKLALVLAAIWLVILGMRWYVRRTGGPVSVGRAQSRVELLETRGLGGHRSLQLVRLGDRAVLLGVTQERITPLLEVADPEELERLVAVQETEPGGRSFAGFLSGFGDSFARLRERRFGDDSAAPVRAPVSVPAEGLTPQGDAANAYQGMRVADLQRALQAEGEPQEGAAR